jgi:hypothetical protein
LKELFKTNAITLIQSVQPGYRKMQDIFKQIAQRSMLDKDYRDLCLNDSKAAIQEIVKQDIKMPDNIIFLDEDGERLDSDTITYVLPPFLKKSWLLSK